VKATSRPKPTGGQAYVAGVVAYPAYTGTFADRLTTPGIRVPVTADPALFAESVALGVQVIWLHTYGDAYAGPTVLRATCVTRAVTPPAARADPGNDRAHRCDLRRGPRPRGPR
jgi:hypothetical protein